MITGRSDGALRSVVRVVLMGTFVLAAARWGEPAHLFGPLNPTQEQPSQAGTARADSNRAPQEPPDQQTLRALLTPSEQTEYGRQSNIAKRMKLLLRFAARRLDATYEFALKEHYDPIARLTGEYQRLISSAFSLIEAISPKPSRRKSAYRDFDLELRKHIRTLERIERIIPLDQSADINAALKTATRLRHNALNAFAGDHIFKPPAAKNR